MLLFYPDDFRGARLFCFDIRVNKSGGGDGKSCVKRRLTNVRKVYIIASIKGKGVLESDLLDAFFAFDILHITIERRLSREKYRKRLLTESVGKVEAAQ